MGIIVALKDSYRNLISVAESLQSFLLLAIRLFWGWQFYLSGSGKLQNLANTTNFFKGLSIPFPELNAYAVGYIEMIGGICLMLGFLTRMISLPLIAVMIIAFLTAHFDAVKNVLTDYKHFVEQAPFIFLFALLIVFSFGPGKISIDYLMKRYIFKDFNVN